MKILDKNYTPSTDYSGKIYYFWTVVQFEGAYYRATKLNTRIPIQYWKLRCNCGFEKVSTLYSIFNGTSKSCNKCSKRTEHWNHPKNRIGNKSANWKGTSNIPMKDWTKVKSGAESRGIECLITIEDLEAQWVAQSGKCAYTGRALIFNNKKFRTKGSGKDFHFASLDRIDSSKGYIIGNIQWVCTSVNLAKHQYSDKEFLRMVKDIYEFRLK